MSGLRIIYRLPIEILNDRGRIIIVGGVDGVVVINKSSFNAIIRIRTRAYAIVNIEYLIPPPSGIANLMKKAGVFFSFFQPHFFSSLSSVLRFFENKISKVGL